MYGTPASAAIFATRSAIIARVRFGLDDARPRNQKKRIAAAEAQRAK